MRRPLPRDSVVGHVIALLRNEGISEFLYGSTGVVRYIDEDRDPDDVDFLVPPDAVGSAWSRLQALMASLGFEVSDEHEHEFTDAAGTKIAFAPDRLREDGIVVTGSDLVADEIGGDPVGSRVSSRVRTQLRRLLAAPCTAGSRP